MTFVGRYNFASADHRSGTLSIIQPYVKPWNYVCLCYVSTIGAYTLVWVEVATEVWWGEYCLPPVPISCNQSKQTLSQTTLYNHMGSVIYRAYMIHMWHL